MVPVLAAACVCVFVCLSPTQVRGVTVEPVLAPACVCLPLPPSPSCVCLSVPPLRCGA